MDFKIRNISYEDRSLLEIFLYEAIFVPPGIQKPPRSIINKPELQEYIIDYGKKKDDIGLIAEIDSKPIGAVWARIMNDYGHIDDKIPSLAICLLPGYRKLGLGTALMKKMLDLLKEKGYKQVSLSVQKENYAFKMYQKLGFEIVNENEEECVMVYNL